MITPEPHMPVAGDFVNAEWDGLDERYAMRVFLGKTADQAEAMFRRSFLSFAEDLRSMGPTAFVYYIRPAMRYLLGDAADGDSDAASTFLGVIDARLCDDPETLDAVLPLVVDSVDQIRLNLRRYRCNPDIYGDLAVKYQWLVDRLRARHSQSAARP